MNNSINSIKLFSYLVTVDVLHFQGLVDWIDGIYILFDQLNFLWDSERV